jgi:hypothetical protein
MTTFNQQNQQVTNQVNVGGDTKFGTTPNGVPALPPLAHTDTVPPSVEPVSGTSDSPRLFVSYAHKDAKWLSDFQVQIKPYVRNLQFHAWTDRDLKPGDKWEDVIAAQMANADVGVLLVTPAFLASDFIFENELPALLQKKVFWIAVRDCAYQETPLKDLQCANDPARPLASLSGGERDSAWVALCRKLKAALTDPS